MIVHLFSYSFFVNDYVRFIEENFDPEKHRVVVYRKRDFAREESDSDIIIRYTGKKDILMLRRLLKKADRIIIHSLGVEIEMLFLLYMDKTICKKTVWVTWGSDLYCKRDIASGLMPKFIEHMRETVIGRFPYIGCLVKGDYDLAKEWYKTDAEMIRVNYCAQGRDMIDEIMDTTDTDRSGTVNIIVGNSGTKSNCHLELLERLSELKEEDIHIYIPLSYGDPGYIEEIKAGYLQVFGDKVTVLDKIMPLNDYLRLLQVIDIGVFNNDRQQALGNIFILLYMGKKLFLRKGTSMWEELVDIRGFMLYDCAEISKESVMVQRPDEETIRLNREKAVKIYYDSDELKKGWSKAFGTDFGE